MNRSLIIAAFAALTITATAGAANAASARYPVDHDTICKLLEAAGESNCEEFEVVRSSFRRVSSFLPPMSLVESNETTGGIGGSAPFVTKTVPVKR